MRRFRELATEVRVVHSHLLWPMADIAYLVMRV
jgi:hypothetical protein